MTDTNATTLRNALAVAIKNHVTTNGLKAKDAAEAAGVQYSRLSQILRGDVAKISSDALVNVLGGFGYRVTGIVGSGDGTEIVLSLDKADLPDSLPADIDPPYVPDEETTEKFESGELGRSEDDVALAEYQPEEADPDAGRVVSDDE